VPIPTNPLPAAIRPMLNALPACSRPVQDKSEPHHDAAGQGHEVHAEENVFGEHCPAFGRVLSSAATLSRLQGRAVVHSPGVGGYCRRPARRATGPMVQRADAARSMPAALAGVGHTIFGSRSEKNGGTSSLEKGLHN
jgi:hypothetical protein